MLALILMMPLLCLYADLMGILGGAVVGVGMFDLTPTQYLIQTSGALGLNDFAVGLVKSSRITSYNVCYTKLLRAEPRVLRPVRISV